MSQIQIPLGVILALNLKFRPATEARCSNVILLRLMAEFNNLRLQDSQASNTQVIWDVCPAVVSSQHLLVYSLLERNVVI